MRLTLPIAFVLASALILAGCGTKPNSKSSEPSLSAEDAALATTSTVEAGSEQAATLAAQLVTPADVEKVSGLSGLKVVPKDPAKGAGGDTNIATSAGDLVFMLNVGDGDFYEQTKSGPNFGRDYPGLGDAAYAGPAKDIMPVEYLLGVKSGQWGLVATSFLDNGGKPVMSIDQLDQLAAVAIGRLDPGTSITF